MDKMMVSLKSFVLQHPRIVVGVTMLAIALLANPAAAPTSLCKTCGAN